MQCLSCYLERKGKTPPAPAQVTTTAPIEPDMLRRLIQLCHPDRHDNSEAANTATRYLLELKGGSMGKRLPAAVDLFGMESPTKCTNDRPEAAALCEVLKALRAHPAMSWCERMNSGAAR